jgi:hypothetical protein
MSPLVLRGEAGVGKSALLNEVISAGKRSDLRVLTTAGVSLQMQQAYAGLAHLMRSVLNDPALPDDYQDAWETVRAAVGGQDVPIGNSFSVAYAVLEVLSACSRKQQHNLGVTEFTEIPGRGHALTIDDGWAEVAQTAVAFIRRFT